MAFIGVKVPAEAAEELSKIQVPGDSTSTEDMHVTLIYLGKNVPIPEVLQAILACYMTTKRCAPFTCQVQSISSFPKSSDSGIPIIAQVICPELHKLHDLLVNSMNLLEIEFSDKHPKYIPHVTLAYSDQEMRNAMKIKPISWLVKELVIWGGDHGVERIAVSLPLEGGEDGGNTVVYKTNMPKPRSTV